MLAVHSRWFTLGRDRGTQQKGTWSRLSWLSIPVLPLLLSGTALIKAPHLGKQDGNNHLGKQRRAKALILRVFECRVRPHT